MLINLLKLPQRSIVLDKVYRALVAENQALDAYKYHLVGGAAGTVSPSKYSIGICLNAIVLSAFSHSFFNHFSSLFQCNNNTVGWTFQGGNAGTMGDRIYGTCVVYLLNC